jgi:hypothetical protein
MTSAKKLQNEVSANETQPAGHETFSDESMLQICLGEGHNCWLIVDSQEEPVAPKQEPCF